MADHVNTARVLVIDNDPGVGQDLAKMLGNRGYSVCVTLGVGKELEWRALRCASCWRPHVAIVDLKLVDEYIDDRSGLALLKSLQPARCILYSAYLKPEVTREAHKYAMTWVSKGESPRQLIAAVDEAACQVCAAKRTLSIQHPPLWTSQRIVETLFGTHSDVPHDLVHDLLCQMFPASKTVNLETLEGAVTSPGSVSRGRSVVLKAWRDDRKEPVVVKFALARRIEAEGRNYAEHIENNLGGMYHARLEARPVVFWDLGAVLYSFVGVSLEELPSFASFYKQQSDPGRILAPLHHLFSRVWNNLYAESARLDAPLYDAYVETLRLQTRLRDLGNQQEHFFFPGLLMPLPNPAQWVLRHQQDSALSRARQAITHGDLHADNLFVHESRAWAIDFERSGPGPILRDFVELEVDILTRLVPPLGDDLSRFFDLAVLLVGQLTPAASSQPATRTYADEQTRKAVDVVAGLREMARQVTRFSDFREYLWGILFDALFVATSPSGHGDQRDRALLLGAVVCERLRRWNKPWPPQEWSPGTPDNTLNNSDQKQAWSTQLRQTLGQRFNTDEFSILCSELGVDPEDLAGIGRMRKAQALIEYLDRHGQLGDLFAVGQRLRPDIPWPELRALYEAQHNSAPQP